MPETLTYPIRSDKLTMSVKVVRHLHHQATPFQVIDVYETECLGKMLFLDGHIQLATFDEFAYHESLVHIPLLSVESPKKALVIGGGDGGVCRELAKHRGLERIDVVEIDSAVIESSKHFMPELSQGAFDDPRVRVHIEDAFEFVHRIAEPYDLIVMDVTDVYEEESGELSEKLWTKEFFEDCRSALSENGFMVSQADNHVFCPYSMTDVLETFASIFKRTGSFQALVPSFGGFSGFVWASKNGMIRGELPEHASMIPLRYLNRSTYALALVGGGPGGLFGIERAHD